MFTVVFILLNSRDNIVMRFLKQSLSICNNFACDKMLLDENHNDNCKRHSKILPNTIRCIICGPSNCGKTNVIINLIESPNGVRFENIYVYSKSLQQLKYRYLERIISTIPGIGYYKFSNNSQIVPISEALPNSIFIFDDVACDKQQIIREYFSMGRHSNIDCFYLCQTYAKIPKHLIRDNANLLIIFQQDNTNLRHIYNDHINTDMSYEDFLSLCRNCWEKKYGFLVIDKDSNIQNGRYRKEFDHFAII